MTPASTVVSQDDVIRFLTDPSVHGHEAGSVTQIETHGAIVFLTPGYAYKMKKAVRLPYMDFSVLELRHRACLRELQLNQPNAPDLYLGLIPIRRSAGGVLSMGGEGETVEWLVHMRRFSQDALLSRIADRGSLDRNLVLALADVVYRSHGLAPQVECSKAAASIERTIGTLGDGLRRLVVSQDRARVADLEGRLRRCLVRAEDILQRRAEAGFVRRCHGDLHLGNIVEWQGRPTLFDALEFDEKLATIDTLYDLAFLLMDLDERGERNAACLVLNRYLGLSGSRLDLEGLSALPLFMGLRAGIRAMVLLERTGQQGQISANDEFQRAQGYLAAALGYAAPTAPRIVAVGGLSGTGKSTLAAMIAARLDPAPGAIHLRSDLERKAMAGVAETTRLPLESYTSASSRLVYERLHEKVAAVAAAGHSVVVDAVFAEPTERARLQQIADEAGVRFDGLWLSAPLDVRLSRVAKRIGDASDADAAVVRSQSAAPVTALEWTAIDASGTPDSALDAASIALAIPRR